MTLIKRMVKGQPISAQEYDDLVTEVEAKPTSEDITAQLTQKLDTSDYLANKSDVDTILLSKVDKTDYDTDKVNNTAERTNTANVVSVLTNVMSTKVNQTAYDAHLIAETQANQTLQASIDALDTTGATLVYDDKPTESSENLLKSGHVFTALSKIKQPQFEEIASNSTLYPTLVFNEDSVTWASRTFFIRENVKTIFKMQASTNFGVLAHGFDSTAEVNPGSPIDGLDVVITGPAMVMLGKNNNGDDFAFCVKLTLPTTPNEPASVNKHTVIIDAATLTDQINEYTADPIANPHFTDSKAGDLYQTADENLFMVWFDGGSPRPLNRGITRRLDALEAKILAPPILPSSTPTLVSSDTAKFVVSDSAVELGDAKHKIQATNILFNDIGLGANFQVTRGRKQLKLFVKTTAPKVMFAFIGGPGLFFIRTWDLVTQEVAVTQSLSPEIVLNIVDQGSSTEEGHWLTLEFTSAGGEFRIADYDGMTGNVTPWSMDVGYYYTKEYEVTPSFTHAGGNTALSVDIPLPNSIKDITVTFNDRRTGPTERAVTETFTSQQLYAGGNGWVRSSIGVTTLLKKDLIQAGVIYSWIVTWVMHPGGLRIGFSDSHSNQANTFGSIDAITVNYVD